MFRFQHRLPWVLASIGALSALAPAPGLGADADAVAALAGRVVLRGNVHPLVATAVPLGRCDPGMRMERMILALKMAPEAKARLDQLLADQHNPASPSYHQWLSPQQFAQQFGPSPADLARVTGWLQDQGFSVDEVAEGGMTVNFSGDVATVEQAFLTPMVEYQAGSRSFHANAAEPSIPAALADRVAGVVSLHNLPRQAMNSGARRLSPAQAARFAPYRPQFTDTSGDHFMSPGDFAVIYNVNPLYTAGIKGQGVSIAVVGRTHPKTATGSNGDWAVFRSQMGLPANPPVLIINGTDPGDQGDGENGEADLDVEWSGAVAPSATIDFVVSASTANSDGADLSAQYIVNKKVAPILTMSFSACETAMGQTGTLFYNTLWSQAAVEGITAFVASGDSGAAGCDTPTSAAPATQGAVVNGLASSQYNVAVGGSEFNEGASNAYWSATNSDGGQGWVSALSYIPEVVWNEVVPDDVLSGVTDTIASGGGASLYITKPSWQVAPGVPNDGKRDLPDVALSAAEHDGYIVQTTQSENGTETPGLYVFGGTSCATPSFAGLMALLEQKNGLYQGNANVTLYQLGNAQTGSAGPKVFHDITQGNNSVPGQVGFSAGVGYDPCTGLGSVDATALVDNWGDGVTVTVPLTSVGLLVGQSYTFSASVTGTTDTAIAWSATGGTLTPGNPSTTATFAAAAAGSYTVTAAAALAQAQSATITVNVHGANFLDTAVSGLDVLDLVGHYGTVDPALALTGDATVGLPDLNLILQLLGW